MPFRFAVSILRARGCDEKICRTIDAFYNQHQKYFKLDGHYDQVVEPRNGIIQGCPLSILILASMIKVWPEHLDHFIPEARAKSYVDDISAAICSRTIPALITMTQKVHEATATKKFCDPDSFTHQ